MGNWTLHCRAADPNGWCTAANNAAACDHLADLFYYLRQRAAVRLNGPKPSDGWGQAAYNWYRNQHVGRWVPCLLFSHGQCNQTSQSRPLHTVHDDEPMDVFPVLAFVVPGLDYWAYECPALAMMGSSLWKSHHSCFFEIPADAATAAGVAAAAYIPPQPLPPPSPPAPDAYVPPRLPPPPAPPVHDPWFGPHHSTDFAQPPPPPPHVVAPVEPPSMPDPRFAQQPSMTAVHTTTLSPSLSVATGSAAHTDSWTCVSTVNSSWLVIRNADSHDEPAQSATDDVANLDDVLSSVGSTSSGASSTVGTASSGASTASSSQDAPPRRRWGKKGNK